MRDGASFWLRLCNKINGFGFSVTSVFNSRELRNRKSGHSKRLVAIATGGRCTVDRVFLSDFVK